MADSKRLNFEVTFDECSVPLRSRVRLQLPCQRLARRRVTGFRRVPCALRDENIGRSGLRLKTF
jgi:hypothetical protein